jgi:hypothetical protein
MKVEEYIKKKVVLYGYGTLNDIALDAKFFTDISVGGREIENVLEIDRGMGGNILGGNKIEGCILKFKNGSVFCIESDGEYVDAFSSEEEEVKEQEK